MRSPGRGVRLDEASARSRDHLLDDVAVEVGEPGVVEPHQVEDRGVEVVDVDGVLGRAVAVLVGEAEAEAPLDAAAGQEAGEAPAVMAAAARGQVLPGGAAELRTADDERL